MIASFHSDSNSYSFGYNRLIQKVCIYQWRPIYVTNLHSIVFGSTQYWAIIASILIYIMQSVSWQILARYSNTIEMLVSEDSCIQICICVLIYCNIRCKTESVVPKYSGKSYCSLNELCQRHRIFGMLMSHIRIDFRCIWYVLPFLRVLFY